MTINVANFERIVEVDRDIAAIPGMTPAQRADTLARYQARADELAPGKEPSLSSLLGSAGRGYADAIKRYYKAQRYVERIEQAIRAAESREDF